MQRLHGDLPKVRGAVWLSAGERGWLAVESFGDIDARWALSVLGNAESFEAVTKVVGGVQLIAANRRNALLIELERGGNIGAALAYAYSAIRMELS